VTLAAGGRRALAVVFLLLFISSTASANPVSGDVLIAGGFNLLNVPTASAEYYSVSQGQFIATGPMHTARAALQAQSVEITPETTAPITFVFGGSWASTLATSGSSISFNAQKNGGIIETFNRRIVGFIVYSVRLLQPRSLMTAVPFPGDSGNALDGHVLVVGGLARDGITGFGEAIDPVQLEDTTGNMQTPSIFNTATLLNDGTVLITGGIVNTNGDVTDRAELLDPVSFNYSTLSSTMTIARAGHSATLLNNGDVLIAGGVTGSNGALTALKSAEIYDPVAQTFTAVGDLSRTRTFHSAALLGDGTVLVAAGSNGGVSLSISTNVTLSLTSGAPLDTAEIYDPSAQTFSCVGGSSGGTCLSSMTSPRLFNTASTLADGSVLFAGGFLLNSNGNLMAQKSAEIFSGGQFSVTANMIHGRAMQAATVLP
jgi:hypothetical protein